MALGEMGNISCGDKDVLYLRFLVFPYCEQQPTELASCFSQREMQGLELVPALARRET